MGKRRQWKIAKAVVRRISMLQIEPTALIVPAVAVGLLGWALMFWLLIGLFID